MQRLILQNIAALILLIVAQILLVFGLNAIPWRPDLHWIWRVAIFGIVYIAIGAAAYRMFYGSRFTRYMFVAVTPALTVLAGLAVLPTDPAYPGAELLLIIPLSILALLGALVSDWATRKVKRQSEDLTGST